MRFLKTLMVGAVLLLSAIAPAQAQSLLDEIIQRGTLNVGVSLGTPPFGLIDASMQPDGFDVELAKMLARDLGVEVNIVDTVAANRIPSLTSGTVDIVISSFSITAERAKTINFSNTVYVDQQVYVSEADKPASALADLVGRNVGVTRSSTNDIIMTAKAVEGTNLQRYDDDASTSQALLAGQVDGIVTSGALARAIAERDPNLVTQFVVASAPMSIGVRRGDPDLLHWVNTAIFLLTNNGQLPALQEKWMGVSMDLPRF